MRMIRLGVLAIGLVWLGLGASASGDEPGMPRTLAGKRFQSVTTFQVGVLPTGPVVGYRRVMFQEGGKFTYAPSDGMLAGDFTWDPRTGKVVGTALGGKRFTGRFDPTERVLDWDGAKYKEARREEAKKK